VDILLLTELPTGEAIRVLPALDLLSHAVRAAPRDIGALVSGPSPDLVLVDARSQPGDARATCRMLRTTGLNVPLLAVVSESGLAAVSSDWCLDDVILTTAGPAEIEARIRLAVGHLGVASAAQGEPIRDGELAIDPDTYTVRLRGVVLNLTYKEFELIKYLAQHPGRVFTRDQLLRDVWGYDYFGGTRTVDVHVRRLRAKLGSQYESMIGTVRQVGYKFVTHPARAAPHTEPVDLLTPA
jgi:DNA-binding response OmpR family regulator